MWLFHCIKKRPLLCMEGQKVLRSKLTFEPKISYSFHRSFYMNYSTLPYIKVFFRISSLFCYFSLPFLFHVSFILQENNVNTFTAFIATHCSSKCTDGYIRRCTTFRCWRRKGRPRGMQPSATMQHFI